MDKLFRQVSVKDRLPENPGSYNTDLGKLEFSKNPCYNNGIWLKGNYVNNPEIWFEEITLESIQDKRELTATFLVNSIRLLDEQGARHLVKELCERFHLLPTGEDINYKFPLNANEPHKTTLNVGCRTGANYILKALKGEKR
ncbi:hypothetical protein [Sphingobacterium thalpophilum]|uniref:hypothetical protein n=1 Tax=Sphingobacterium thalpophilum TaxID=259 RepID=UPI003D98ED44